jgi:hypothetical protein
MPRRRLAQDPARMLRTALGGALVAAHCAALFGVASGSESQSTQRSPSVGLPRISLDGVRPFLNSVLQGNGTVVAAAGAAWGVRALRHAAERSNIQVRAAKTSHRFAKKHLQSCHCMLRSNTLLQPQERVERLFNKGTDAGGPLPFQVAPRAPVPRPTAAPALPPAQPCARAPVRPCAPARLPNPAPARAGRNDRPQGRADHDSERLRVPVDACRVARGLQRPPQLQRPGRVIARPRGAYETAPAGCYYRLAFPPPPCVCGRPRPTRRRDS